MPVVNKAFNGMFSIRMTLADVFHLILKNSDAMLYLESFKVYSKRLSLVNSKTVLKIFSSTASKGRFRLA